MILLGSKITNADILSVQTGGKIGAINKPIIDPSNLKIVAYQVQSPLLSSSPYTILVSSDIREISDMGVIIDSIDNLVAPDDVVKIEQIIDQKFSLNGIQVIDNSRKKLGKVSDYTVDSVGYFVQQLDVKKPLLSRLNDTSLLIHRSQIIEVASKYIVVHSEAKIPEPELSQVVGSYVNPFRKPKPGTQEAHSSFRDQDEPA